MSQKWLYFKQQNPNDSMI